MRHRRRLPAPILVLLAVVALTAIAVAPRGMLRVVAAEGLAPAEPAAGSVLAAPDDDVDLPGVRALVAREEDVDDGAVARDDAPSSASPALATEPRDGTVAAHHRAPALVDLPRSPHGDRAPPRPI